VYIDKFTAHVRDLTSKKSFKIVLDGNDPQEAHKKIYNRLNNYQEIVKLTNHENEVVYNIDTGFINN
jgi:hypothetical protein